MSRGPRLDPVLTAAALRLSSEVGPARAAAIFGVNHGTLRGLRRKRKMLGPSNEEIAELEAKCMWCGETLPRPGLCERPRTCRAEYIADAAAEGASRGA